MRTECSCRYWTLTSWQSLSVRLWWRNSNRTRSWMVGQWSPCRWPGWKLLLCLTKHPDIILWKESWVFFCSPCYSSSSYSSCSSAVLGLLLLPLPLLLLLRLLPHLVLDQRHRSSSARRRRHRRSGVTLGGRDVWWAWGEKGCDGPGEKRGVMGLGRKWVWYKQWKGRRWWEGSMWTLTTP